MAKKKEEATLFDPALTFEEALEELEQNVQKLEEGKLPLSDALKVFKKSIELSDQCLKELDDAEQVLTKIVENEQGVITEVAWDPAGGIE